MKRLRVLVVEDSLTIRRRLCDMLTADPEIEVVGEAEDGKRAIELCGQLRPDVMTLDMVMPVMSGLAATEYIMAYHPTPILIVSASLNRGDLFKTYDALAAGAVDVLEKPAVDAPEGFWERRFIATVKMVAKIKVITHVRARLGFQPPPLPSRSALIQARMPLRQDDCRVAAIGASTGGPAAIIEILNALPVQKSPLLFVMHIGEPFGMAFADWLDSQTPHRVSYATEGAQLDALAGRVIMAPPGRHLEVDGNYLRLTEAPLRHSCRPSVDVLFESLARHAGSRTVGCLLTGMGRDGANGLLSIRRSGGITVAQDQASSVVYGMPREAALLGAAQFVLPVSQIAPLIARALMGMERASA